MGRPEDWVAVEFVDEASMTVAKSPVQRVPSCDEVLIACSGAGRARAIGAWCPHQGLPLAEFARAGRPGAIVCSAHGCEFDVESGECVGGPTAPAELRLPSWPLEVAPDGSRVVNLGQVGLPDRPATGRSP